MLNKKENKVYTLVISILIIAELLLGILLGISGVYIFFSILLLTFAFLVGIFIINGYRKRIEKVADNLDKEEILTAEIYSEDEIGALATRLLEQLSKYEELYEKRLKEKEYLRDLIADMSHQIKTPVAALTIFNDVLLEAVEDDELTKILEQSESQLERITWLLKALLQLARIEAESVTFDKKEIELLEYLNGVASMVNARAMEKNIELIVSGDDCCVSVDPDWFQEALINVIKNAIDYSPSDSRVEISVSSTPIATKLIIKDYGKGIAAKDRINVFKRFYRASGGRVNPNSVGIGLALTKGIVEAMDGKIWIESVSVEDAKKGEQTYTAVNVMILR